MMLAPLRTEITKLVHRPALRWTILTAATMSVLFGYVIPYYVIQDGSAGQEEGFGVPIELLLPEHVVENTVSGFPLFYLALALVLGALSSGSEYTWRTVRLMVLWGPGRWRMMAAKITALVALLVLVVLAAYAASAVASVVVALVEGRSLQAPPVLELFRGMAVAWLILAVGGVLGLLGGVIARNSGAVIGAGLVYVFVIELLLRNFARRSDVFETIAKALPGTNAGALAGSFAEITTAGSGAPGVNDLVGATTATIVLVAWLATAGVAAMIVFWRRDVTS